MAGHNKWAKVKRLKAVTDSRRSKVYTKLLREIQVSARLGGGVPAHNPRLKRAIEGARAQSIPNDTIEKSINRGTGDIEGVQYEEVTYEAYGPGGVGIIIKALTENKTRTVADVRHALSRNGGNLAASNAVSYQFHERGVITVPKELGEEDKIMEAALNAGADDIQDAEEEWEIMTMPSSLEAVKSAMESLGAGIKGEVRYVPDNKIELNAQDSETIMALFDALDELDDVQDFYSNCDLKG